MRATSESPQAGALTKFRLLMWKNFLQQWRHKWQTAVELFLPVLTMSVILIVRWQVEPSQQPAHTYPMFPASTLNYSLNILAGMNLTDLSIAYSPTSPELEDVVRTAMGNLLQNNARELLPIIAGSAPELLPPEFELTPGLLNTTDIMDIIRSLITVTGYDSSDDLRRLYIDEEMTRTVLAAVQFDDSLRGTTDLPNVMSYSLRFPEMPRLNSFFSQGERSWRTELVFPAFEAQGPRSANSPEGGTDPGYVIEMFIALQNAISMELVSRKTGEDMQQFDVNLQRFPHPPYILDNAIFALQILLPVFVTLSFSYTVVNIVRAIVVEKELQLKEIMKIMGLPTWLHWTAWFCKQFIYLLIASTLLVILLKVHWFSNQDGFSDYAVFTNTSWSVLFFYLVLYLTTAIFFSFMLSGFFSTGSRASLFTGVIWFMSSIPGALLSVDGEVSTVAQTLACLSINSAMTYGFELLLSKEGTGGMHWGEFFDMPSADSSRFTFGHVVVMLVVDCVLYMLIALYLEQVLPGPFGTPEKWYFLFQKEFWCPSGEKKTEGDVFVAMENNDNEDLLMEKDPIGHTVGVKMTELTKVFEKYTAVNHLTLNIYDDQITVLLGHNGAGKSTTISMLTGNLEATSGSVVVAGYDMSTQSRYARAHLGLCPQHNVLFNELTVAEHLEFFARLKGFKGDELKQDIDTLIEKLELPEKRNYQAGGLSGGQKRRLCVGIALSGGARVVLLDEPTSGMDPASRRALWDLLQKEKRGRSMILTTHFMDEADFLGDRVAIMAHGRLQCVGSPHFLKHHHGVGYSLVVGKQDGFDYDACRDLLSKHIPGISVKDDRGSEITYGLLNEHAHLFEEMLNDLEENIEKIKFKNYGLVATTLEDVFLSLGSDVAPVHSVSEDSTVTLDASDADSLARLKNIGGPGDVSGIKLLGQHVLAVWMKLALVWMRSWGMVLLQLCAPLLLMTMTLFVTFYVTGFTETIVPRNLSLTEGYARTETLLSYSGSSLSSLGALAKNAYQYIFESSGIETMALTLVNNNNIEDYYMERATESISSIRHTMLIGATFEEESAVAHFSNFAYHDIATSLAAVHSALLQARSPGSQIHVINEPIETVYADQHNAQTMMTLLSMQLANGIGNSVGIVSAVFVMFYIRERASGAKLLQKAAGLQPAVLWLSSAVFDWLWFMIISVTIVITCAAFDVQGLSSASELGRLYLLMMIYGWAMLPMNYLFTLLFKGPAIGFVVVFFINTVLGALGPQVVEALATPQMNTTEVSEALDVILQYFPLYSFVSGVRWLNHIEMTVQSCLEQCDYMQTVVPGLDTCNMDTMCQLLPSSCCVPPDAQFQWEKPGVLRYMVHMLVSCVAFWTLLMVIEYGLLKRLFRRKKTAPALSLSSLDTDVADEIRHTEHISRSQLPSYGLVAREMTKYYGDHLAVDQISFTVNDSECFGLLGVNGAGKTTTFKMLMGDEAMSSGNAFVSGYSVASQLTRVHENIGYCPQFDAVFGELTGRETLRFFGMLRGMDPRAADSHSNVLADALGFLPHLDKRAQKYSGGTKRKLSTAVAFLGRTRLVFVDEPTTGVDPAAKRHVWRAVRSVQKSGRGVVLTSHSMEECEALCSRLTIMVNGRFQCLGSPQHLKNKFSQGYTLTIKLKIAEHARNSTVGHATQEVKDYVSSYFTNPKIMEEYEGVLTYYLPDTSVAWSKMFGVMERAKRELPVEYYSIAQTTLEQIFLQFTKYQR